MDWHIKAVIQNLVDALPDRVAYTAYYAIQQLYGGFKSGDQTLHLKKARFFIDAAHRFGTGCRDKTFLEIGTGRALTIPVVFWLFGARSVITVDLNPYLKAKQVFKALHWMLVNEPIVRQIFGSYCETDEFQERFACLGQMDSIEALIETACIRYLAPVDAAALPLADQSIDYHCSTNVMEHISPETIKDIFLEARRLLSVAGLVLHRIDLSDHFSHADASITSANFLQFDEAQWDRWAGNTFMYHNRLRAYDFTALFDTVNLKVVSKNEYADPKALQALRNDLSVDARFARHTPEELAVSFMSIIGRF